MSGITGFNREDKTLLNKALNLIKHRGPDDEKFYINSEFSMGIRMTILSNKFILNPPIHNEQEDIWLICDGEIYNFLEIETLLEKKGHKFYTDNSSEVIVHAYEEWDCLCVEKFRGEFVFCIYDFRKNLIFLARDPIGIKTLYYYFDGKNFIFGSEIKSILCHDIKKEFNKRAFGLYLSLRYVPFEITMFKGIRKVPNSCYLLFDLKDKSIKIRRYWDYIFDINRNKTEAQFADELKNLIIDSIKIRLRKNLPIGAFLSGGLDSSAVVGVLSKLLDKPVRTFSIGFEEGAPINEIKYAKLVADFNGCDHTELNIKSNFLEDLTKIVWYNDDLIADAALIPVYLMGKEVKKHLDIVFTGDGADEVFAGYSVYYRNQISKYEDHIPKQLIELSMKFNKQIPSYKLRLAVNYINKSKNLEDRYIRALLQVPDAEKSNFVPFKVDNVESLIKGKLIKDLDIINRFTHWDLKYQLPSQYNVKADRAISAASLIGKIPLLDNNLVSWSLTIPSTLKLNRTIEKYILRVAMKDYLPKEVLKRKKQGFGTPINLWINTSLKETSGDILDRLERRSNIICPNFIKKIKRNRFSKLFENVSWNLIMFELWYETFIEKQSLYPISF